MAIVKGRMEIVTRLARLLMLVGTTLLAAIWAFDRVNETRDSYQDERPRPARAALDEQEASKAMLEQSKMFETWTIGLLSGLLIIVFTAKIHRIPNAEWLYIVVGPAAALLLGSLHASWVFRKRFTFLVLKKRLYEYDTLMRLLNDQTVIFQAALIAMIVFGSAFLIGIVMGAVRPFEEA